MIILFNKHFFVGFMVSDIPRVSVFENFPNYVTFPYFYKYKGSDILAPKIIDLLTRERY